MTALLLKHNADTEARERDEEQQTILHTAACFNNVEIAKLLVEYNANIEAMDEDEKRLCTLLHAMVAET